MAEAKPKYYLYIAQPIIISIFLLAGSLALSENLFKEEAVKYRQKGYEAQKSGMLADALTYYNKAIQMDPASAAIYNDLAVVHEALNEANIAEEAYLKAIAIDPGYEKAYYNLALLYEGKGDLSKASEYWLKLTQIGAPEDLMVEKAKNRIYEIGKIIPQVRAQYLESEVSSLNNEVSLFKKKLSSDNKAIAQSYIEKADTLFKKGDYLGALKMYLDAQHLDPQNNQIDILLEETQKKILL